MVGEGRDGRGKRREGRRETKRTSWRADWSASVAGPVPGRKGLRQEEAWQGGLLEGCVGLLAPH